MFSFLYLQTDSLCQSCKQNGTVVNCKGQNLTALPTDLPLNMTELDFSFNNLDILSNNMFELYLNLENLRLDNNIINNISGLAFCGLSKLRLLNISSNRIGDNSISGTAFEHIRQLDVLAIQNNTYNSYEAVNISILSGLFNLEIDVFHNFEFDESFLAFQKLKKLSLNPRTEFHIKNNSFIGLNNSCIERLDLRFQNKVKHPIGEDFLQPFHSLKDLHIRFGKYCDIKDVLRALHGLSHRDMESLDLAFNVMRPPKTQTLTDKDLEALGNICVKRIDLSRNTITSIQSINFWNSTVSRCVQKINIAGNNLNFLDAMPLYYMSNFENIQELDIGHINFHQNDGTRKERSEGGYDGFSFMGSKKMLNFTFRASDTLHTFNMSGFNVQFGDFWTHSNILYLAKGMERLDTTNTNISFCEIDNPYYFVVIANITEFDMSGWNCAKLKPTLLADTGSFFKLKELSASNAKLDKGLSRDKYGKFLKGLRHLNTIDLSRNNLTKLHDVFFQDQISSLQNINLNDNHFRSIPSSIYRIQNVTMLGFKSNSFACFSPVERQIMDKWDNIEMDFRENFFSCTCNHLDSLKWILQNKDKFRSFDELQCRNHGQLHLFLKDISNFEIKCVSREWLIISVLLLLIILLAVFGTSFVYRYRYSACFYFLRARKYFTHDNHTGFHYDVFISHTPEDEKNYQWVTHTLYPFLTNVLQLHVSIEEKNFLPGTSYVDSVHDTMDQSRKILVVFSAEFLRFSWSQCHLEMARMHTFHKDRSSMIVIVLDDIPKETLPQILRSAWWKIDFIYWPEDVDEEEKRNLFWQQLKMTLKNRNSCRV